MRQASTDLLGTEEVQLLADGCQPLFVSKLSPFIKRLVERGLMYWVNGMCPHSQQPCFVLKTTQVGRALIAAWIVHHRDDPKGRLRDCEYDSEVRQYIDDATGLVSDTAAQGGILHVSQSFSGSPPSSAIVISLVACPEALALQLQEAIDQAVEGVLCKFPVFEPTVH